MTLTLNCGDIVPDCEAVVRAESEDELLRQAAEHARDAHGMAQIDDATLSAIKGAIRTT